MAITPLVRKLMLCVVVTPASAFADESMMTTANQASEMAPGWVWWTSLLLLTLVAYPAATRLFFASGERKFPNVFVWVTSVIHLWTGAMTIVMVGAVSLAYSRTSPLLFIAFWIATTIVVTLTAFVVQTRLSRPR